MANIKDKNNIPQILAELQRLMTHGVQVGVFGDENSTVLMIATVQEFGVEITVTPKMAAYLRARSMELGLTPETGGLFLKPGSTIRIPERSFFRSAFDENESTVVKSAKDLVESLMHGETDANGILGYIGAQLQGAIQRQIKRGEFRANHPFTIASKGSSQPLVDTGLLGSPEVIKWRIVPL